MIKIGQPTVIEKQDKAFLWAPVSVSDDTAARYQDLKNSVKNRTINWNTGEDYPPAIWRECGHGLWFCVQSEYSRYLCSERGDPFLVAMLWYAMMTGSDIECDVPISSDLYFKIVNHLLPALLRDERPMIEIKCKTVDEAYPNSGKVGSGMSCGLDSLFTLYRYTRENVPEDWRLTHLTYFNHGSIFDPDGIGINRYHVADFYQKADEKTKLLAHNAQIVSDEAGLPFLFVSTNLDPDYYRGAFGLTAVYRNVACVLALQGLFKRYYLSSGGYKKGILELELEGPSERYEIVLSQVFSTNSLQFIVSDQIERFEKTKAIADFDIAKRHLDVCFKFEHPNCCVCSKCRRTLLMLDCLGKTQDYAEVFDLQKWNETKVDAYYWMLKTKDLSPSETSAALYAQAIYSRAEALGIIPKEAETRYQKSKKNIKVKKLIRKSIGKMKAIFFQK